jgi:hypothetical protein
LSDSRDGRRWVGHRSYAAAARIASIMLPLVASLAVSVAIIGLLPEPPGAWLVAWWAVVIVAAALAALATEPLARRVRTMATLLALTVEFPGVAPSRARVALGAGRVTHLQERLVVMARAAGPDDSVAERMAVAAAMAALRDEHLRDTHGARLAITTLIAACFASSVLVYRQSVNTTPARPVASPIVTAPWAPVSDGTDALPADTAVPPAAVNPPPTPSSNQPSDQVGNDASASASASASAAAGRQPPASASAGQHQDAEVAAGAGTGAGTSVTRSDGVVSEASQPSSPASAPTPVTVPPTLVGSSVAPPPVGSPVVARPVVAPPVVAPPTVPCDPDGRDEERSAAPRNSDPGQTDRAPAAEAAAPDTHHEASHATVEQASSRSGEDAGAPATATAPMTR